MVQETRASLPQRAASHGEGRLHWLCVREILAPCMSRIAGKTSKCCIFAHSAAGFAPRSRNHNDALTTAKPRSGGFDVHESQPFRQRSPSATHRRKTRGSKSSAAKPEVAEIKTRLSKGAETSGRLGTPWRMPRRILPSASRPARSLPAPPARFPPLDACRKSEDERALWFGRHSCSRIGETKMRTDSPAEP